MGTRNRPGAFDCAAIALDDEETFVLLARSPESPDAVTAWASHRKFLLDAAREAGSPVSQADYDQVAEAFECANRMRVWRHENMNRWRDQPRRDRWATVEIMGHRRHCGRIREVEQFGLRMLLVEVPTSRPGEFVPFQYAGAAIFCISPSDEASCRREENAEIVTPVWISLDGGGLDGALTASVRPAAELKVSAGFLADLCVHAECPYGDGCVALARCQAPKFRTVVEGLT